ncbi:MAG: molybdenum cofactor biosynthesis protein MoaE [Proteobacteria bacterium]|nr:molybdenum cofactor biosynthesis protein MoaE [Pseudomonadota bacterium]
MESVRLQEEDFSVEAEIEELKKSSLTIGGIVTFLGTARDFSEGRDVKSIEFEQYANMALDALKALRESVLERFDIIELRIVHRIATVEPGGQIVLIVVGSEHRAEAFDACRFCIDELKKTVPLWKKEITPSGEQWVTEHP